MGAGHQKENAINTAQSVHVFPGKGSTVLIAIFSPRKKLRLLDSRYRKNSHMIMRENLESVRIQGSRTFIRTERQR